MASAPQRLNDDAIVEAVLELRFDSTEAIPEIVVARLADRTEWKAFRRSRLPIAELPQTLRMGDPNLRVQPLIELSAVDGTRTVKIGTNVVSIHNVTKYLGWKTGFQDELDSMIKFLFKVVEGVQVRRVGLRYINAFTKERHHIGSPLDLNIDVKVNNSTLTAPFNLNFNNKSDNLVITTRIATREFVQGVVPSDMSAYLDVDISSPDGFTAVSSLQVRKLVDEAHAEQRNTFFGLLPKRVIEKLEDKS